MRLRCLVLLICAASISCKGTDSPSKSSADDDKTKNTSDDGADEPDGGDDAAITIAVPMGLLKDSFLSSYLESTKLVQGFKRYTDFLVNPPSFKSGDLKSPFIDYTLESVKQNNEILNAFMLIFETIAESEELKQKSFAWGQAITHKFQNPLALPNGVSVRTMQIESSSDKASISFSVGLTESSTRDIYLSFEKTKDSEAYDYYGEVNQKGILAKIVEGTNQLDVSGVKFTALNKNKSIKSDISVVTDGVKDLAFSSKSFYIEPVADSQIFVTLKVSAFRSADEMAAGFGEETQPPTWLANLGTGDSSRIKAILDLTNWTIAQDFVLDRADAATAEKTFEDVLDQKANERTAEDDFIIKMLGDASRFSKCSQMRTEMYKPWNVLGYGTLPALDAFPENFCSPSKDLGDQFLNLLKDYCPKMPLWFLTVMTYGTKSDVSGTPTDPKFFYPCVIHYYGRSTVGDQVVRTNNLNSREFVEYDEWNTSEKAMVESLHAKKFAQD